MHPIKPLLLLALLVAVGHAAGPHAAEPQAGAVVATTTNAPVPLLWKVSDADSHLYLLGSFHMLKPDDYPLSPDVDAAFADAESLLFEIDPSELNAPETIASFQAATGYDDGSTLSQVLPAGTFAKLEKLLAASGSSVSKVDAAEPWAVSLGLVMGVSQAMGFRQEHGLDRHFMALAAEAGKPVAGLEGIDAQLAALDGVPRVEQVAELDEFLTDPGKSMAEFRALHETWRAGDADKLDRKFRQEMADESPASYRLVNVDRNNAWVPLLEARLAAPEGDTLAVVGALHLLGDDGVVEKLRAKGYAVERICSACAGPTRNPR